MVWRELASVNQIDAAALLRIAQKFRVSLETLILQLNSSNLWPGDSGAAILEESVEGLKVVRKSEGTSLVGLFGTNGTLPRFLVDNKSLLIHGGDREYVRLARHFGSGNRGVCHISLKKVSSNPCRFLMAAELREGGSA
jgi:hypothetical protein